MAMYDFDREIILQGIVTTFEWANPHVYIYVETVNATGAKQILAIEGPALRALELVGWTEHALSPGDGIIVAANPAFDAERMIVLGNSVLTEDGEALAMGGSRLQEALAGR